MNPNELPLAHESDPAGTITMKLIGVGGAGLNAITRLHAAGLKNLQLAAIDTDRQKLNTCPISEKLLIGAKLIHGMSTGSDPENGYKAAEADHEKIAALLADTHIIYLAAALGRGTGGGAAPYIAQIAADTGAIVIAFATMPFNFEGGQCAKRAEESLAALRNTCDAVIVLPNDLILQQSADTENVPAALSVTDGWISHGVRSIWSILCCEGLINLNLTTLRQIFHGPGGKTLYALGSGTGENAVADTIASLKMCPLAHTPDTSRKVDRILINIVGGTSLNLVQVNEIMTAVRAHFGRDADTHFGAVIDDTKRDEIEVCVLGTTDIGTRNTPPRRPSFAPRQETPAPVAPAPAPDTAKTTPDSTTLPPRTKRPPAAPRKPQPEAAPIDQVELGLDIDSKRGSFEKSDRNLFEDQDLDVPTYLRKGIKILL